MIVDFSSIVSDGVSLNWLDTEAKDRILFVDQNWSMLVQEDEVSKESSDPSQSGSNKMKQSDPNSKESLDYENIELSEQTSLRTQRQSALSGE